MLGRNFKIVMAGLLMFCLIGVPVGATMKITLLSPKDDDDVRFQYPNELIRLAMEATVDEYGPFEIDFTRNFMITARLFHSVKSGKLTFVLFAIKKEREAELMSIKIPINKGLLGHRIFLIREGDQERFSKIKTLEDLKQLKAGQGEDWTDTLFLEGAGIPVEYGSYRSLFKMLKKKRFDYYPRGIFEAPFEAPKHSGIVIEKSLMLVYKMPSFFYTSKENVKEKERLEKGLNILIQNGTYDKMFNEMVLPAVKESNPQNRTIIRIDPEVPFEGIPEDPRFWFDVSNL